MATPAWQAGQAGILGTASAVAASAQVNQLLGTHSIDAVYPGTMVVGNILDPFISSDFTPNGLALATLDLDQGFHMSGTSIGRVTIPVTAVGNGADLLVSLFTDSSGNLGTLLTQTRVPASWITRQSAVVGIPGEPAQSPVLEVTGAPLATGNALLSGTETNGNWPYPAVIGTGAVNPPTSASYENYIFLIGGVNAAGSALSGVFTVAFNEATNSFPGALAQPVFPVTADGTGLAVVALDSQAGTPVVVVTGGSTSNGGAANGNVYTAGFTATTGVLSAWSAQTGLGYSVRNHAMATSGGFVYVIGGTTGSAVLNTVTYGQVQNGQISAWSATTPLPVAGQQHLVGVCNGFLIVTGGADEALNPYTAVWYTSINADGSLGSWIAGPALPNSAYGVGFPLLPTDFGVISPAGWSLPVTSAGLGREWTPSSALAADAGIIAAGGGAWTAFSLDAAGAYGAYTVAGMQTVPEISVPLPTSGLTSGNVYHLLIQQQGGTLNDYLLVTYGSGVLHPSAGYVTMRTSPAGAYTWTTWPLIDTEVAVSVYDNSIPYPVNPMHTWEDDGARISTLIYATTPDQRLLGLCEATTTGAATNANQGFETGISPWTCTGGTVVQSSTRAQEGTYAAQITPSGTDTQVTLQSELIPCLPGQAVSVSGWAWFTSSVTSAYGIVVNWYTLNGTYISTSSPTFISVAAHSWWQQVNTFTAPATAYQYQIASVLGGTPAASNIWYVDQIYATTNMVEQLPSVVSVPYPGTWPGGTFPPLGLVELA